MLRRCIPEERKKEFVLAAMELFTEKGYENTSVLDIALKVGVAKGLFYHYFKTKDDVLMDIMEYFSNVVKEDIREAMSKEYDNVFDQVIALLTPSEEMIEFSSILKEFFKSDRSAEFHKKFEEMAMHTMVPAMTEVLRRGKQEGVMDVIYPEKTAASILVLVSGMADMEKRGYFKDSIEDQQRSMIDIMSRIVGMKLEDYPEFLERITPPRRPF